MDKLTPEKVASDLTKLMQDSLYVTVGFGVLAAQKAEERRQETQELLDQQLAAGREQVDKLGVQLDEQLSQLEQRLAALEQGVDALVEKVVTYLPDVAAEKVRQARDAAKAGREQLRNAMRYKPATASEPAAPAKPAAPRKAPAKAAKATKKTAA